MVLFLLPSFPSFLILGTERDENNEKIVKQHSEERVGSVQLFAGEMGAGIWIEPLVVVTLLFGGAWVNRARAEAAPTGSLSGWARHKRSDDSLESGSSSPRTETGLLSRSSSWGIDQGNGWRTRTTALFGVRKEIRSPDTSVFSDRLLSRILRRFPFLVEVWYWALIYWVYQLGRALTAVTLVQGAVHTARQHALQLIRLERALGIFWEPAIQRFFLQFPALMHWINRIYSFIHIPGTISFLIGLFHLTVTANRNPGVAVERSPAGPALYQSRRRTMAMSNLIAFVIFTTWPCMPPRLLSDPGYEGPDAEEAKGFRFVDTVHGPDGESSIWTQNKACQH